VQTHEGLLAVALGRVVTRSPTNPDQRRAAPNVESSLSLARSENLPDQVTPGSAFFRLLKLLVNAIREAILLLVALSFRPLLFLLLSLYLQRLRLYRFEQLLVRIAVLRFFHWKICEHLLRPNARQFPALPVAVAMRCRAEKVILILLGAHLKRRFAPTVLALLSGNIGVTFSGLLSRLPSAIGVRSFVSR